MTEKCFTSGFASDLISDGTIAVPFMLLRCYAKLGINETELMLLIHLLSYKQFQGEPYPQPEDIAKYMSIDCLSVKSKIASLIEKNLLTIERQYNYSTGEWTNFFSFTILFDKLAEVWAVEKAKVAEEAEKKEKLGIASANKILGQLYQSFEKEFGRLLTPMENSQIVEWCQGDGYSPELILEALKRSVLRGVLNFKYIDSILRDWQKNNIFTVNQAVNYEEKFYQIKGNVSIKKQKMNHNLNSKPKKDKYKDLYLS
ncbi:DnaD domain protein [Bacillota bacterium LX-D]|nr:DnaD domain protein [Bacillota bacterium LX-D]